VLNGMGLIVLHSGHFSKIFTKLMGTSCNLQWREAEEKCIISKTDPSHPIAQGVPDYIVLEHEEMYGEYFDIPKPESIVFTSWFQGGNVFRGGITYTRGKGKIFYFHPGHETHDNYRNQHIQKIIINACNWAYNPDISEIKFDAMQEPLAKL